MKKKIIGIEKLNKTEFVKIGSIKDARGIAKGISSKNIREEKDRI